MEAAMLVTLSRRHVVQCAVLCLLTAWPRESAGQNVYANRFEWDGALDQSFPNGSLLFQGMAVRAAATDSSRRIVIVGEAGGVFMTVRLTANGALDTTFGGDGIVYTSFSGPADATAVAIRPNGSILTAGTLFVRNKHGFAIACYTSTGGVCAGLNQGWGTLPGSRVETWFPSDATADGIAVAADGSFVVAGGTHLARYSPYGTPSASFGNGGTKTLDDVALRDIALDAEGRIVAAGYLHAVEDEYWFAVMRFAANGDWDSGFGTNGIAMFFDGCSWAWGCLDRSAARSLAIDAQGRVVAGGYSHKASGGGFWLALTRVLSTGDVDPEFGFASIPPHGTSFITDVKISAGARIWITGHHGGHPFIARFTYGGDVDSVFISNADPAVVHDGTVQEQGCPGGASGLNASPQVVEQSFIVAAGPNTISVVRKAVLISQCFVDLVDF
jgi:uncharacterized delta-60 repeat protein